MGTADVVVVAVVVLMSVGLLWFFFGPRRAPQRAERDEQVQKVTVVLRGGYRPQRIEAVAGVAPQIVFDRQESGDCTSRIVFADLGITRLLPAYERTTVELVPTVSPMLAAASSLSVVGNANRLRRSRPPVPGPAAALPPAPKASSPAPEPVGAISGGER